MRRELPAGPREAINQITGRERRLLALRGYIRFIKRYGILVLRQRWAWTEEEYRRFARSADGQALQNEVAQVIQTFNRANPGYRLVTARTHRPLAIQINLWNRSRSVARISMQLLALALREQRRTEVVQVTPPYLQEMPRSIPGGRPCLAQRTVPIRQLVYQDPVNVSHESPTFLLARISKPQSQSVILPTIEVRTVHPDRDRLLRSFRRFIQQNGLVPSPTNATPGLSRHGTGKAIDFVIYQGGAIVLTTGDPGRWQATGMDRSLQNAIAASGPNFDGPLRVPDEPWHYNYVR
jgi:hypothetical protein